MINPIIGVMRASNNQNDHGVLTKILPDEDYRFAVQNPNARCESVVTNTFRFKLPLSPSLATDHERAIIEKCFSRDGFGVDKARDLWVFPNEMYSQLYRFTDHSIRFT